MPATTKTGITTEGSHDAYETLLQRCRASEPTVTAVAYPCEETALTGAVEAAETRLITPILLGPREKILEVARAAGLNIDPYPIEDVPDGHAVAARAVELVRSARAEVLMKGRLHSDELMAAVVEPRTGKESRTCVLGHLQRGGSPTNFNRALCSMYGAKAVEFIAEEQLDRMVAFQASGIGAIKMSEAISELTTVPPHGGLARTARALGICLGD